MKITRDVITDLLPLYLEGQASADTRALVEAFFAEDPEFARLAKDQTLDGAVRSAVEVGPAGDHEADTVRRTRALLRRRSWWLGFGLMFTAFPMSFVFNGRRLIWLMVRDAPEMAAISWLAAAICWFLLARTRNSLKSSGL